jgi:hypothetical protein
LAWEWLSYFWIYLQNGPWMTMQRIYFLNPSYTNSNYLWLEFHTKYFFICLFILSSFKCHMWKLTVFILPIHTNTYNLNSKGHTTLNKRLIFFKSLIFKFIEFPCNFFNVIKTQIYLIFSKHEDWFSCFRINGSENDFIKHLYDWRILFWCCNSQEILIYLNGVLNILILWPYVNWLSLILWSNLDPNWNTFTT